MAAHHMTWRGSEREYSDVTTRCRRWTVRAKSGTSLLRAMRATMARALFVGVSRVSFYILVSISLVQSNTVPLFSFTRQSTNKVFLHNARGERGDEDG